MIMLGGGVKSGKKEEGAKVSAQMSNLFRSAQPNDRETAIEG